MSYDGNRVMAGGTDTVYVVIDNNKCKIPDMKTSKNLWATQEGIQILTKAKLDGIPDGAELSEGAVLAMATDNAAVFLITGGQKRKIHSMTTFSKYGFSQGGIYKVPKILIDPVPPGTEIT
jgi:hypothetical protein